MPFSVSCGNGRRRQRACAMPLLCCAMILLCFAMILLCLLCSCDVLLRCCYKLLCFCYVLQSRRTWSPSSNPHSPIPNPPCRSGSQGLGFCRDCECPLTPAPSTSSGQALSHAGERECSRNRHGHFNAFEGIVAAVAFGGDDAVGDFHAADDFSECRVLTVQERRIGDADKKL